MFSCFFAAKLNKSYPRSLKIQIIKFGAFFLRQCLSVKLTEPDSVGDTDVIVTMMINDQVAEELVTLAYENGVNVFDTAEVYAGGK